MTKSPREETYAYCDNDRCRLYLQVAHVAAGGVLFDDHGFATECRSCNVRMTMLCGDDLDAIREDPDYLRKRKEERKREGGDR